MAEGTKLVEMVNNRVLNKRVKSGGISSDSWGKSDQIWWFCYLILHKSGHSRCGVIYLSDWLEHDEKTLTLWHGGIAPTQVRHVFVTICHD